MAKKSILLSPREPEFAALTEGPTTVVWLRRVFKEFVITQGANRIAQDNSGTIKLLERGPKKHFSRRKAIDIELNHVMDLIKEDEIKLYKVDTVNMMEDYLTYLSHPRNSAAQLYVPKHFQID